MKTVTHPFEYGWFKYLCEQYKNRVYITNKDGKMLIVVEQDE